MQAMVVMGCTWPQAAATGREQILTQSHVLAGSLGLELSSKGWGRERLDEHNLDDIVSSKVSGVGPFWKEMRSISI